MYPGKTEPMIKNTTHSAIDCNGMANNDDYHGLEMYKNHAKDSTTEGYMQPDPTTMECGHHGIPLSIYQITKVPVKAGRQVGAAPPTRSQLRPTAHWTSCPGFHNGRHQPPYSLASQCWYVMPAHLNLLCADQLTQSTASKAVIF